MENLEQKEPKPEVPVPQPVPQPQTSETKPKNPLLLPIFLSLVMFILGGGLVFAYFTFLKPEKVAPQPTVSPTVAPTPVSSPSSTPDPTANWEIYEDEEYGFEIKYPQYLTVRKEENPASSFSVGFVRKDNQDFYEFLVEKNFGGGWMGKQHKEEKIMIDGVRGSISLWLLCDADLEVEEWEKCTQQLDITNYYTATLHVLFEKESDKWHVLYKSWKKGEKDEDEEIQILSQILSTFKFLD